MKVLMIDDDQATLDLVAHFLGIATHHNINAAPSGTATPKTTVGKTLLSSGIDQLAQRRREIKARSTVLHQA
ncbi:MAG: hypothetical protein U0934_17565 [Pseudotabrizicola sp.]|uniref:hypothetical protein n=1 Tax=Pseudotabrizicola sp. TaxID=2939647 RepID=UPI00271CBC32|nr:hypothetical protein [Pseudotabrizicola sp.]MDO8884553.1 hypothetical protein [Pseudotabrizicola sp.]MDP2081531.1 hypothetical protein [Pseudotabrizicola sp.]MDZ7575734.1 hypothetical protein [Pseudotabrizicola sp.]